MKPFALLSLLAFPALALADDAYNAFPSGAFPTAGPMLQGQSFQFTAALSGNLTGLKVGVAHRLTQANDQGDATVDPEPFSVNVYSDASDRIGGLLGSFSAMTSTVNAETGSHESIYFPVEVAASGIALAQGASYWVTLTTTFAPHPSNGVQDFLVVGYASRPGSRTYNPVNQTYQSDDITLALAVHTDGVAPVPEPAPLAALGVGAIALMGRRRKPRD